ncbi:retrovirus-related pol polyprotein from transposon TNT 1-94 [Tanacetum coccineum]
MQPMKNNAAGTRYSSPMIRFESTTDSWKIRIQSEEENKLEMADTQAEIILSQGLPRHIFNNLNQTSTAKEIWDNVEMLMQGSEAYEPHAKKTLKKQEQSTSIVDPLAYVAHTTTAPVLPSPSTSSPQPTAQSPNDALMATMTQIANLLSGFQKQFPPTNNQLRTSSNSRNIMLRYAPQQECDMLQLQGKDMICTRKNHIDTDAETEIGGMSNTYRKHQFNLLDNQKPKNFQLENIFRIQLQDTITSLRIQLDGLKVENVSLKRRYDELSKANTHSRTAYTAKLSALTTQHTKLQAQVTGTTSSGPSTSETPKVLAPGMYNLGSKYIPPPKRANWVKPTPLPKKRQVTFSEPPRPSLKPTQKPVVHPNKQTNVCVPMSTGVKPTSGASKTVPKRAPRNHSSLPAKSANARRVEAHHRTLNKKNRVDSNLLVKHSVSISNLSNVCGGCNKSLVFANHNDCLVMCDDSVNDKPLQTKLRFGNDEYAAIIGYGDYKLGDTIISRVYYVEGLKHNLFSVGQFCDGGLEVAFRQHSCHIRNYDMVDLLKGSRTTNLYSISLNDMMSASPVCLLTKASSTKSWLWHRRLNHLNFGTLNELARKNLVRGLPMLKYDKDHLCPSCQLGKSKKASHPLKTENTNTEVLHTLHMDLCGPMRTESINGKKYVLVIVDDYTRFGWNDFFRSKDETPQNNGDGVFKKPLLACYTLNLILVHDASRKDYNERLKGKKPKSTILPSVWISCYPTNDLYDDICKHKTKSRIDPEPPSVPPTKKQVDDLFQWFDDDEVCTDDPPGLCPITPVNVPDAPAPENANGSPSTTVISEGAPAVTESLLPHQVPLPDTSDSDVETLFDHVDSNVFDTYNAPETYCLEASSSKLYRSDKTLHCSRGGSRSMNMVNFPDGRENRLPQRWSSKKQKSSSHRFHYEAEYIALSRMLCSNPLDAVLNYDTMAFVQQQIRFTMADANINAPEVPTAAAASPPTRSDEQILPRNKWVPMGKSNCFLDVERTQANPIFKIAVDILKNTNFFKAFTASSTIISIYIQQFWDTIRFGKDKGYSC